jgi:hypothetical protein
MTREQYVLQQLNYLHKDMPGTYLVAFNSCGNWYIKSGHASKFLSRFTQLLGEFEVDINSYYNQKNKIPNFIIICYTIIDSTRISSMDTEFRHKIELSYLSANYINRWGSKKREVYIMSSEVINSYYSFYNKYEDKMNKNIKITINSSNKIEYNNIVLDDIIIIEDSSDDSSDDFYDKESSDEEYNDNDSDNKESSDEEYNDNVYVNQNKKRRLD